MYGVDTTINDVNVTYRWLLTIKYRSYIYRVLLWTWSTILVFIPYQRHKQLSKIMSRKSFMLIISLSARSSRYRSVLFYIRAKRRHNTVARLDRSFTVLDIRHTMYGTLHSSIIDYHKLILPKATGHF